MILSFIMLLHSLCPDPPFPTPNFIFQYFTFMALQILINLKDR
ncbi:hypothetical protein X975_20539, partial [Stegodyphus mimosarum]